MDKDQFIKVLQHYSGSSVDEAQEVLSLKESYPYSQLLHALSARVTKDHGFSNQSSELQLAAVYAADRAVLKEIMCVQPSSPVVSNEISQPVVGKLPSIRENTPSQSVVSSGSAATADLAEEVMHDLERLNELRHNFELMFTDQPTTQESKPVVKVQEPVKVEEPVKTEQSVESAREDEPLKEVLKGKSKKERIVEMAKALEQQRAEVPPETTEETKKGIKRKRKNDGEELIEEIVSTKEELEPESEKQKEQIELIDQFIKSQPTITNSKDKPLPPPVGDLASTKTGEFGDNIVSETLVEILVKQGKKDRAIEVLKKLIWKFPQKKAYFAAQIEDLRK